MAIDSGSNATKYRVWEIDADGEARLIAERRFAVRIGEGVFTSGKIGPESIAAAVEVFKTICDDKILLGVRAARAVTTSAAREASNRGELVDAIRSAAGIELRILPDADEARLIALGILAGKADDAPRAIVDIGGGSTEIILARGEEVVRAISTRMGAVRMAEIFFEAIPPAPASVERLEQHVRILLGKLELPVDGGTEMLGCGGTITALNAMVGNGVLELAQVDSVIGRLGGMNVEQVCEAYRLDEERAQIILAGALVLRGVMRRLGQGRVRLVRGGVSDGLMREFVMKSLNR